MLKISLRKAILVYHWVSMKEALELGGYTSCNPKVNESLFSWPHRKQFRRIVYVAVTERQAEPRELYIAVEMAGYEHAPLEALNSYAAAAPEDRCTQRLWALGQRAKDKLGKRYHPVILGKYRTSGLVKTRQSAPREPKMLKILDLDVLPDMIPAGSRFLLEKPRERQTPEDIKRCPISIPVAIVQRPPIRYKGAEAMSGS